MDTSIISKHILSVIELAPEIPNLYRPIYVTIALYHFEPKAPLTPSLPWKKALRICLDIARSILRPFKLPQSVDTTLPAIELQQGGGGTTAAGAGVESN